MVKKSATLLLPLRPCRSLRATYIASEINISAA
jgi:hypothetical protein